MKKILAALGAPVLILGLGSASQAATTTSGAYSQTTGGLSCVGHVQGDGDGGTLRVRVSGKEVRASDQHFRTWTLRTRVIAQEKNYRGRWVRVARSGIARGELGRSRSNDAGTTNTARFVWGSSTRPTISVPVRGFDDLFRAKVVTRIYDDEGARIKVLRTYQGQCRL